MTSSKIILPCERIDKTDRNRIGGKYQKDSDILRNRASNQTVSGLFWIWLEKNHETNHQSEYISYLRGPKYVRIAELLNRTGSLVSRGGFSEPTNKVSWRWPEVYTGGRGPQGRWPVPVGGG